MPDPSFDEYVRVQEAARILGVSPNTVRNWAERGKLKEYRNPANGYRLFDPRDLEALLRQTRESATTGRPASRTARRTRQERP